MAVFGVAVLVAVAEKKHMARSERLLEGSEGFWLWLEAGKRYLRGIFTALKARQ